MKKLAQTNILKIKKILQNKGYKIYKNRKTFPKDIENFFYITIVAFFFIGFFYVLPFISNFAKKAFIENQIVLNNSNINFNRVLEGKEIQSNKNLIESDEVNFKDLFYDVFQFDINEQDTVRLSASTIKQLFKDENYNLKDIRKNKLVKPINIDLLPNEIRLIENVKKRKELFIQIVLPLILEENKKIRIERKTLFSILYRRTRYCKTKCLYN